MRELFPQARIVHISDDLPQEPADHPQFWSIWRETVLRAAGEPIDWIFASENYGHRLAAEVGATFIPVDIDRTLMPVSGTAIRTQPFEHWPFIPECVRPYFVKRVCIFGPESAGKSTLARDLAAYFHTVYVSEFARGLLDPQQGVCKPDDIPLIARGQLAAEEALARRARRVLICDTDLLTTTIWSEVLFGSCPEWIRETASARQYDLYLLLDIDVPWIDDRQRFLPHARQSFFDRCEQTLWATGRPYHVIRGSWSERFTEACRHIEKLLSPG